MQTLEQIVDETLRIRGNLTMDVYMEKYNNGFVSQITLDKLAKLREDVLRQIEECVQHEIDIILGKNT